MRIYLLMPNAKEKVENILSKFFNTKVKPSHATVINSIKLTPMRNSFIEYMSYRLKNMEERLLHT